MENKSPFNQQIIGLYSSVAGSGKSTVARMLSSRGFNRVSFADTLKGMAYSMLIDLGMSTKEAFEVITEDKSRKIEAIGVDGRHLLRTLGTEWGRQCIHPELWLKCWEAQVAGVPKAVVDDVRFPNEAELVRSKGGLLWRIVRPDHQSNDGEHASEGALDEFEFDRTIVNDGTLAELATKVFDGFHETFQVNAENNDDQKVQEAA